MEEGVEARNPVDRRQPCRTEHAPFAAGNLHKPQTPAAALRDVFRDSFRRQAHAEPLVQVRRLPTRFLQLERQQHIFRHTLGGKAADLLQRLAPRDRGGPAAECHAPGVLGGEQHIEEEALFVGPSARGTKAVLQRVGVKEVLRRLDATDLLVSKQRQRATEELRLKDKIGVDNGYDASSFESCRNALLILPAFACSLFERVMYPTLRRSQSSRNQSRRPSSRTKMR